MAWRPLTGFFIQAKGVRWRLMDSTGVHVCLEEDFSGERMGHAEGSGSGGGGDHLGYSGNDCRRGTERRQGGTARLMARCGSDETSEG